MAAVKFNKGSEEWMMFMDYWNICQKYWIPNNSDEYWQELMEDINIFMEKYREIELSKKIALAFIETQEIKNKR